MADSETEEELPSKCYICIKLGDPNAAAEVFCPECNELLCSECKNYHKYCKGSKDHETLTYEDYKRLPPFIMGLKLFCDDHDRPFTHFCRVHDKAVCVKCHEVGHQDCKPVPKIHDIVKNVKDSVGFTDVVAGLETLCGNFKEISDDRIKNVKELKTMCEDIKTSIEGKIDGAITHLQKLKEKTILDLNTLCEEVSTNVMKLSKICLSRREIYQGILDLQEDFKTYTTNVQTFIGIKELERLTQVANKNMNELYNDDKLRRYEIKFKFDETVDSVISLNRGIMSLGGFEVTASPSELATLKGKPTEAQKDIQTQRPLHLQLQQKIELVKGGRFFNCCTLPSGLMALTELNDLKLCLYQPDGVLRRTIGFSKSQGICDVTAVDENHVAVSHPKSKSISIVNVMEDKVTKTFKTGDMKVRGFCCRGRDLICCVLGKGLATFNMDTEKTEMVVQDTNVLFFTHVTANSKYVCYTCSNVKYVKLLDEKFDPIFLYKDEELLRDPMGVALDDKGNIYVTGQLSQNLLVVSPEFKTCQQLLCETFGLEKPTAVAYNIKTDTLTVVNYENGPAFRYSILR